MGPSGSVVPARAARADGQAVRRRGDPALRHRPRALDEPLPPRGRRAPRSRLSRVRHAAALARVNDPHDDLSQHPDLADDERGDARRVARGAGSGDARRGRGLAAPPDADRPSARAHAPRRRRCTVTVVGRRLVGLRRGGRRRSARAAQPRRVASTCTSRRRSRSRSTSRRRHVKAATAGPTPPADRFRHALIARERGCRACSLGTRARSRRPRRARSSSAPTMSCSRRGDAELVVPLPAVAWVCRAPRLTDAAQASTPTSSLADLPQAPRPRRRPAPCALGLRDPALGEVLAGDAVELRAPTRRTPTSARPSRARSRTVGSSGMPMLPHPRGRPRGRTCSRRTRGAPRSR